MAAAVALGVAIPLRHQALDAADEYGRLRRERHDLQARLSRFERAEWARRRVAVVFAPGGSMEDRIRAVRRSVLGSLGDSRLTEVRVGVQPTRATGSAAVRVRAEGPFADVLQVTGRLARPGTGLILDQVRLNPRSTTVALEVNAVSLEGRP